MATGRGTQISPMIYVGSIHIQAISVYIYTESSVPKTRTRSLDISQEIGRCNFAMMNTTVNGDEDHLLRCRGRDVMKTTVVDKTGPIDMLNAIFGR